MLYDSSSSTSTSYQSAAPHTSIAKRSGLLPLGASLSWSTVPCSSWRFGTSRRPRSQLPPLEPGIQSWPPSMPMAQPRTSRPVHTTRVGSSSNDSRAAASAPTMASIRRKASWPNFSTIRLSLAIPPPNHRQYRPLALRGQSSLNNPVRRQQQILCRSPSSSLDCSLEDLRKRPTATPPLAPTSRHLPQRSRLAAPDPWMIAVSQMTPAHGCQISRQGIGDLHHPADNLVALLPRQRNNHPAWTEEAQKMVRWMTRKNLQQTRDWLVASSTSSTGWSLTPSRSISFASARLVRASSSPTSTTLPRRSCQSTSSIPTFPPLSANVSTARFFFSASVLLSADHDPMLFPSVLL